jgi:hypothetical protein
MVESKRGRKFDLGTLDAYMDMSQSNPFVQLIYGNKKWEKRTGIPVEKIKKMRSMIYFKKSTI